MRKKTKIKKGGKSKGKGPSTSIYGKLCLLIGLLVLFADQLSKYFVDTTIPRITHESQWFPYNGIGIFENFFGVEFALVHRTNRGAAWGMFSEFQDYLLVIRVVFIAAIIVYLMKYNKSRELVLPLMLIIVGAVGNIVDYFVYGHVVDMFKFVFWGYHYPVFNIADASIFIGVFSMVAMSLFKKKQALLSSI